MTKINFKIIFLAVIITTIAGVFLSSGVFLNEATAAGTVPDWFKGVAGFWSQNLISTEEFLAGIEFLIEQEIIKVDGYGLLAGVQAQEVDQDSHEAIWAAIDSLQSSSEVPGPPGQSCWDLNGNGVGDVIVRAGNTSEDTNGDGLVDVLDCQGPSGTSDLGFYVRSNDVVGISSNSESITVTCDVADRATGGGWAWSVISMPFGGTVFADGEILKSKVALLDGNIQGWTVTAVSYNEGGGILKVYVICADANDFVEIPNINPQLLR